MTSLHKAQAVSGSMIPPISNPDFAQAVKHFYSVLASQQSKRDHMKNLNFYLLDNSICESAGGQLKSQTVESKIEIFKTVKKCGFKDKIVASFSNKTFVDDLFCKWLKDNAEDFSTLFAFSEVSNGIKDGKYDTQAIPTALEKMKKHGLYNTVFQVDLSDKNVAWGEKFTIKEMCSLAEKWMNWVYDNINKNARIVVNLRDISKALYVAPDRVIAFVTFLAKMPKEKRIFALLFEEALGEFLPEDVAAWSSMLRSTMEENGWQDGHLLCHIHEKWGFNNACQLAALSSGCNGIWASVCEEGAALGHACSAITILNLVRLGNAKVIREFDCKYLREAAKRVTEVTTSNPPHARQVVYGERVTDLVFGSLGTGSFDLAQFFLEKRVNRITSVATPQMIKDHLVYCFEPSEVFTLDIAQKMKEKIQKDLQGGRKEEYQSPVGIALLFDRAGGSLTSQMAAAIAKEKVASAHHQALINQIKATWDEWNMKETLSKDSCLEFNSFHQAFASRFLGSFGSKPCKQAFAAIDMDNDGRVHWNEFSLYLKWALRQYPDIEKVDELLAVAFRKGIFPAMADEIIKQGQ